MQCKSHVTSQISNRPTPLLSRSGTKDAGLFASFEAYNMTGFVRKRKTWRFEREQRFSLEQKYFGG